MYAVVQHLIELHGPEFPNAEAYPRPDQPLLPEENGIKSAFFAKIGWG
jgi:hypothetical protein